MMTPAGSIILHKSLQSPGANEQETSVPAHDDRHECGQPHNPAVVRR